MKRVLLAASALLVLGFGLLAGLVVPRAGHAGSTATTYTYPTTPTYPTTTDPSPPPPSTTDPPPSTTEPPSTSSTTTTTTTTAPPPSTSPPATTVQAAIPAASIGPPGTSYVLSASLAASVQVAYASGSAAGGGGVGVFNGRLALQGTKGTLTWSLSFRGLTGPALAAHIHIGAAGRSGGVAIPLCAPCRPGIQGVHRGTFGRTLLAAILRGGAYVNVHTAQNGAGEIRGQTYSWLSYQAAKRTASLMVVQSLGGGFDQDGHSHGSLTVTVPQGWTVSVRCSNAGSYPHSCAIVKATSKALAFPGATAGPNQPGKASGFRFVAGKAGTYRIACLVPGHLEAGMWDRFVVARSGLPSLSAALQAAS